jgi:hypothetical protein
MNLFGSRMPLSAGRISVARGTALWAPGVSCDRCANGATETVVASPVAGRRMVCPSPSIVAVRRRRLANDRSIARQRALMSTVLCQLDAALARQTDAEDSV